MSVTERERRSRTRRRGGRQGGTGSIQPPAPAYITRKTAPYEIISEDGLDKIEYEADRILDEVGIEFRGDPEALELFRAAGAKVTGDRVQMEPGMAKEIVTRSAPSEFTHVARNRERSVKIGGDATVFVPAYGAPFVRGLGEERRYATLADLQKLVKLSYMTPNLHHAGGVIVEPVDIPVETRHLDITYSQIRYTDKAFMGAVTSGERAEDSIEMTRILFGADFVAENCCTMGLINSISPLAYDATMLDALKAYVRARQPVIVAPFIISGASGLTTPAAILAQSHAENLAGLAYAQLLNPGVAMIYGFLMCGINMRSGAPVRYEETWLSMLGMGQLSRRLGLPFRTGGNTSPAKTPDFQAGVDSALFINYSVLSGANFILHAAGNCESGLCLSFEKYVYDCETLGALTRATQGIDLSDDAFGFNDVKAKGSTGNFLDSPHTLARYKTAFFDAKLADSNSFEQWSAEGSKSAENRAHEHMNQLLDAYERPSLDQAVEEELEAFMDRRRSEINADPSA